MASEERSTRDRLIESAMHLFYEQGYHATGLAEVLKRAEANSGSLYYFFKTKEELLLAVLDRYSELLWPIVMQPAFKQTADPIERIFAVLEGYRAGLEETGCSGGCPIGNLALELSDTHPAAREKLNANFDLWVAAIQQCLEEAGDRFRRNLDRAQLARYVLTVMEGGILQARAYKRLDPFDQAIAQLRSHFDGLMSRPASRRRVLNSASGRKRAGRNTQRRLK